MERISTHIWIDLNQALAKLNDNHSMCLVSFVYGFLISRGVRDEDACNISSEFG